MKLLKTMISFLLLTFAAGYQINAYADSYDWYWGGDILPRDYSEYCVEPGIDSQCAKTCSDHGYRFPNNGVGEGNGQAYCKELVTHWKLWCSCDTSEAATASENGPDEDDQDAD